MEGIVIIVLVFAIAHALERGRAFAWGRAKSATRTRWQTYKAQRPVVSRGSKAGVVTGRAIGAATVGAVEGIRGFGIGAKTGWAEGREKAYAWHARRHGSITDLPAEQPVREPAQATGTDGPVEGVAVPAGTRARLQLVDPGETPDAPAAADRPDGSGEPTDPSTTEGNEEMTIDTATGGDVQTMEQLIAELETIGKEAAAELEDAQGDAQRAKEDAARIDTMVASLSRLNLDSDSLAELSALSDDAASRLSAAEARANSAESRAAHAQQAIEGVRARHQLMQEAHDATPHAANREFYGH